jgi:hypothetical protein
MTTPPTSRGLRGTLTHRTEVARLLGLGVVLAMGVNILSDVITDSLDLPQLSLIVLGAGLVSISALAFAAELLRLSRFSNVWDAALVINRQTASLVDIPRYEFGRDVHKALQAVFLENKALAAAWNEYPLVSRPVPTPEGTPSSQDPQKSRWVSITRVTKDEPAVDSRSRGILIEAVEYAIIEMLSTHLSTHFNDFADEDRFIQRYKRENVPDLLLQNRVLALLTTPIEDRSVFMEAKLPKNDEGELIYLWSDSGAVYSRFDLVLPAGTTVQRARPGLLRFETNRLIIEISVDFSGTSIVVPSRLLRWYVGIEPDEVDALKVRIGVRASLKTRALFRRKGWEYYEWLDTFMGKLEQDVSLDRFLRDINWDVAETQGLVDYHTIGRAIRANIPSVQDARGRASGKSITKESADRDDSSGS